MMKTAGYGALTLAVVATLVVGITNASLAADVEEIAHEQSELVATVEAANLELVGLKTLAQDSTAEREALQLVLAERAGLKAAADEMRAALKLAHEKVDATDTKKRALEAQEVALKERTDPGVVKDQAADIRSLADELKAQVAAYDEEQARQAAEAEAQSREAQNQGSSNNDVQQSTNNGGDSGGGNDWFGYARWKLNSIGGGWVNLELFDGNCGGKYVNACAWPGVIKISNGFASMGQSRQDWAIVHEYAHQFQFNNWGPLHDSARFQSLYGGDLELLANCMASSWGYWDHGHAGQCHGERLSYAAGVWNGAV